MSSGGEFFELAGVTWAPLSVAETLVDVAQMVRTGALFLNGDRSLGDVTIQALDLAWPLPGISLARTWVVDLTMYPLG